MSTKTPANPHPSQPSDEALEDVRDPKEMSFLDHLEELRGVLFKCLIAFLAGLVLVIVFIGKIADVLTYPLEQAYKLLGSTDVNLITTQVFEIFNVLIAVCFLSALVVALPFMLYFGAQFVSPGLTSRELRILKPGCAAAFLLFLVGAAFAFFLVLPNAIFITLKLNEMFNFEQYLRAGSYYATVVWVTFAVGLAFEFPLVLILLTYIDIVSVETLRASRRLAFVLVLIASALITPGGDPFTLMLLAIPLYGLYEVAIWVSDKIIGKRPKEEDTEDDSDPEGDPDPSTPPSGGEDTSVTSSHYLEGEEAIDGESQHSDGPSDPVDPYSEDQDLWEDDFEDGFDEASAGEDASETTIKSDVGEAPEDLEPPAESEDVEAPEAVERPEAPDTPESEEGKPKTESDGDEDDEKPRESGQAPE